MPFLTLMCLVYRIVLHCLFSLLILSYVSPIASTFSFFLILLNDASLLIDSKGKKIIVIIVHSCLHIVMQMNNTNSLLWFSTELVAFFIILILSEVLFYNPVRHKYSTLYIFVEYEYFKFFLKSA